MLPTIFAIISLLLVIFLVYVATRPAEFRITRTGIIHASPAATFAHVNDLHKWEAWSPWAKLDPQMKVTFEGPPSGTGASQTWNGNKKVGEGRMTITQSQPGERIAMKLEFLKPFTATNASEFTFEPQGGGTLVAWSMTGRNNFMMKLFGVLMNMDKMIGRDFEKGLAALKMVVESESKAA